MDSKLRKMAIMASMAVILLVALLVMYVNREQLASTSGQAGVQNAGTENAIASAEMDVPEEEIAVENGQIGNDLKAFLKDNTFFDQEVHQFWKLAVVAGT